MFVPQDAESAGLAFLRLRGSVPLRIVDGDAVAEFELQHEKSATFILEASSDPSGPWTEVVRLAPSATRREHIDPDYPRTAQTLYRTRMAE